MKNRKGFTLLEIMIVIAIMSFLAMVTLSWVQRAREQANLSNCLGSMRNIAIAVEQYMADTAGQLPPPELDNLVPSYLRITPVNNKGAKYQYLQDSETRAYTIFCPGITHMTLSIPADYPRYCSPGGQMVGVENYTSQ